MLTDRKNIMIILDNEKLYFGKTPKNKDSVGNTKIQNVNSKGIYNNNSSLEINPNQIKYNNYVNSQSSFRTPTNIKNRLYMNNKEKVLSKFSLRGIPTEEIKIIDNIQSSINQSINKSNNQSDMNIINEYNINNLTYILMKKDKEKIRKAEADFPSINYVSSIFTYICFWTSKYQKRKLELLQNAERKIFYYLEVFNYIKKIQEVDLMKYCLFDKEESFLLNFLSYPSFRTCSNIINETNKEFESEQIPYQKLQKKEIDEVFNYYNYIKNKENITKKNIKLLKLMDAEVDILG